MKTFYLTAFLFISTLAHGQLSNGNSENTSELIEISVTTTITTPTIRHLYPNPASHHVSITVDYANGPMELVILDAYNRKIKNYRSQSNRFQINEIDLKRGYYRMILITDQGEFAQEQKLVIQ